MDDQYREYIRDSEEYFSPYAKRSLETAGRKDELSSGGNRTEFERDCHRILHSFPFRRLKHKTQVFFSPKDDHICTRIEHSLHVASISETICKQLKLNATLAEAIALGHDLGHPPFGHLGEKALNKIHKRRRMHGFTHEAQSLRVVDYFKDSFHKVTLNLTYEVRDGIVCHCGEGDERVIAPEEKDIKLVAPEDAGSHYPATLEGCVVRMADRIAYLGRDIEDAKMAGLIKKKMPVEIEEGLGINNSQIIGALIDDVVIYSKNNNFIGFSEDIFILVQQLKDYNDSNIYQNPKLKNQERRIQLMLSELFRYFLKLPIRSIKRDKNGDFTGEYYHKVYAEFMNDMKYDSGTDKRQIISDFIAGMTDNFAIKCFEELFSVKAII